MATVFCPKCGTPLPSGAQFCSKCGASLPAGLMGTGPVPTPEATSAPPAVGAPPPPPPERPLSQLLGVQSTRTFLLQHLLVGPKHSYRVMNAEKVHLFTLGENLGEERRANWENLVRPFHAGGPRPSLTWGVGPLAPRESYWALEDFGGNIRGSLALKSQQGRGAATLVDANGAVVLSVEVTPHLGGISARAIDPAGQPILEARGNVFHLNFSLHDARGQEVAKIHEAAVSVRDTYRLDLVGNVDPVHAVVFSVLIDHFKGH